jgi:hypothetical protein
MGDVRGHGEVFSKVPCGSQVTLLELPDLFCSSVNRRFVTLHSKDLTFITI